MPKVPVDIYINVAPLIGSKGREEKLSDSQVFSDEVPPFKQHIYTL